MAADDCTASGRPDHGPIYEPCDDTHVIVTGIGGDAWYGQMRVRDWRAKRRHKHQYDATGRTAAK